MPAHRGRSAEKLATSTSDRRLPFAASAVRRSARALQRHGRYPGHPVESGLRTRRRGARRNRLHRQRLSDHRRRRGPTSSLPVADINEDGRLVCYPGVEWCGTAGVGGDHNVVFLAEDTTLARSLEWHVGMASSAPVPQTWPITQLYAAYDKDPDSYLLIPHVGGRRAILDWHHPAVRAIDRSAFRPGEPTPGSSRMRWLAGSRLGASAASDEHRGRPGGGAPGANIFGGHGGLTGVLASELTRADVGRALRGSTDLGDDRRPRGSAAAQRRALDGRRDRLSPQMNLSPDYDALRHNGLGRARSLGRGRGWLCRRDLLIRNRVVRHAGAHPMGRCAA